MVVVVGGGGGGGGGSRSRSSSSSSADENKVTNSAVFCLKSAFSNFCRKHNWGGGGVTDQNTDHARRCYRWPVTGT